jgi:hypothetical protein
LELDDFRILFVVAGLILILVAASPALSLISLPRGEDRFSELWLLGPEQKVENYPFNVRANEQYNIFVGVGNQLGELAYYAVYVKFRNQTQLLPDVSDSKPSPLLPLYEFRFFVDDSEIWESLLTFAFQNTSVQGDIMFMGKVSINGVAFSVDCFSMWDSENDGFYFQLFFELWLYDMTSHSFQYHDRFVGIWLNMTVS